MNNNRFFRIRENLTVNEDLDFLEMLTAAYHMGTAVRLGNEFQRVNKYDILNMSGGEAFEHRFLCDRCVISIVQRREENV